MILAIHGRGDDPDGFKDLIDGLPVHARVIVPRAFDALPDGGWSWFPIRARSADVEALARGVDAANDRLAVMIGELLKTRPTRGRAIVTGFSQGGMLSFSLATDHPDLIAAAVPVGGWLPPPLYPPALPAGRLPTIYALHGEVDQVVRFGPTREAVDHLARQGWPAQLQSFPDVAHQIPAPVRRELYVQLQRAVEALP
jgi:phospholipase/carboxylesterase